MDVISQSISVPVTLPVTLPAVDRPRLRSNSIRMSPVIFLPPFTKRGRSQGEGGGLEGEGVDPLPHPSN